MGCSGCSSGRGCSTTPKGCKNNGNCGTGGCNKLNTYDWLANMAAPSGVKPFDCIEVRFKNSRKDFFRNVDQIPLVMGDTIAVEAQSGHDVGIVSLTGELVRLQMKKKNILPDSKEIRKVYRKARQTDIDKWIEAQNQELSSMQYARQAAKKLGLQMKIGDVEYQGDKSKATFYYIADERVDFRELIRVLADHLKVRIEMRQIGSRQEAGRIGGIGSCGRELCCSTWLSDFRTVSTVAARYQQLSINPIKLAGQCGKLKCCLNYELDVYMDAIKGFPNSDERLQLKTDVAFHQKTDVFKRTMWYSLQSDMSNFIALPVEKVNKVLELNRKGIKPMSLEDISDKVQEPKRIDNRGKQAKEGREQEAIKRFSEKRRSNRKR